MITKADFKFKYFTLDELIYSSTAQRYKIDNTPNQEELDHLWKLASVLDKIRAAYGSPIMVTSGYRCTKLNKAVGGVSNSAHLAGYAADMQASDMKKFKAFIKKYLTEHDIDFDQCIIEKSKSAEWVHLSISPNYRKKIFNMNV